MAKNKDHKHIPVVTKKSLAFFEKYIKKRVTKNGLATQREHRGTEGTQRIHRGYTEGTQRHSDTEATQMQHMRVKLSYNY